MTVRFNPDSPVHRDFARAAWDEASPVDRIFMLTCHIELFGDVATEVWRSLPVCGFDELPNKVQSGLVRFAFVARRVCNGARTALRAAA